MQASRPQYGTLHLDQLFRLGNIEIEFLLGRHLVGRVEDKAAGEAQFRYELTQVKDNAETIALTGGDQDERRKLDETLSDLVKRWIRVIVWQKRWLKPDQETHALEQYKWFVEPLLQRFPACEAQVRRDYGAPVYEDEWLVAFAIGDGTP